MLEGLTRIPAEELEALEQRFAAHPDERIRRVALTLLATLSRLRGDWDQERLACLNRFRADPSTLVAERAQFTLPPDEEKL
jgi:hypothetical protein